MIDTETDIFARPPRSARKPTQKLARITCRVCEKPAEVPIDHPALLCSLCLEDLEKTRAHVQECIEKALERLDGAKLAWEVLRDASPARARWERVQEAMIAVAEGRVDKEAFKRQWQLRLSEGGALAALLRAWEVYARETDAAGAELERLSRAQTELNQAWLNTEV